MQKAGFVPREPYPGAGHAWRCQHIECGREVSPKVDTIRRGGGGCGYCARYGFKLASPAVVYVLENPALRAVKVGITGGQYRLDKFGQQGWTIVQTALFAAGAAASVIERAVLRRIRDEMGLTPFLTADHMRGVGGWTETFDASRLPPGQLWQMSSRNDVDGSPDKQGQTTHLAPVSAIQATARVSGRWMRGGPFSL